MMCLLNSCLILVLYCGINALLVECESSDNNMHGKLKRDILNGYDKDIRPKIEHTNTTKVLIRMLIKFLTYEPTSDTLSVSSWMSMAWMDDHLKWTPSDYDGIEYIHLSSDTIWTPDFSLYNGYGSWVHTGEELNITLQNEPITMDEYIPNGHYDVVSINVTRNTGRYKCCPNSTYPSLSYRFVLKRHASVFTCTIIVPAL